MPGRPMHTTAVRSCTAALVTNHYASLGPNTISKISFAFNKEPGQARRCAHWRSLPSSHFFFQAKVM